MKNLIMVVAAGIVPALTDALRDLQVGSFTVARVEGHGVGADTFMTARDRVVGHVPRARFDLLLEDTAVAGVLEALAGRQAEIGHGVWWLVPVEQQGTF